MPTYAFSCDCGFEKTDIDSMRGDRVKLCPKCKNVSLVRLIGAGSGFHFSSGFTDKAGNSVHFKEPYFDTALRRSFVSAKEKADFMNSNGIVEAGDSDVKVKQERKQHFEQKMDTKKEKSNVRKVHVKQ